MPSGRVIRSAVSQRADSQPAADRAAFQLSTPKLKYLKKPRSARFETRPLARASFCANERGEWGSSRGTSAVGGGAPQVGQRHSYQPVHDGLEHEQEDEPGIGPAIKEVTEQRERDVPAPEWQQVVDEQRERQEIENKQVRAEDHVRRLPPVGSRRGGGAGRNLKSRAGRPNCSVRSWIMLQQGPADSGSQRPVRPRGGVKIGGE